MEWLGRERERWIKARARVSERENEVDGWIAREGETEARATPSYPSIRIYRYPSIHARTS